MSPTTPSRRRRNDKELPKTVGELRVALVAEKATWAPPEHLADDAPIPQYSLGIPEGFPKVAELAPVNLAEVLSVAPSNPRLAEPRARIGLLPKSQQSMLDEATRSSVSK